MPSHPAPLPAALEGRVFTRAEARDAGVLEGRLRRTDVRRLGPSLYAAAPSAPAEADIVAALCRADPRVVACGPTAARLWGLPLPRRLDTWVPGVPIHLATGSSRRRSGDVITWHHLDLEPHDVRTGARGRATSPERTFLDLAPLLSHDDLVACGDALVRTPRARLEGRDAPWTTITALRATTAERHGRGVRRARLAAQDVRRSADSPPETWLRLACVRAGLPEPLANRRVLEDGVDLGEPDLHWPAFRVCAEHEGPRHRTAAQQERDIRRAERRSDAGWSEVLTTAVDLRDGCRSAVRRYAAALRRHGWRS